MAEGTDTEKQLALAIPSTVKSLVEALIFASSEPVSALQIKAMVEETSTPSEGRTLEAAEIERTVEALNAEYAAADRPYRIITIAGGYQFATMSAYAAWISRLYRDRMRRKLSQSALESLAIIAYKQPISKPEIEQIRGVNCDYVLKALLEKELVTITGRAETVGRPLLYGTTKEFLKHFGLNSITDLPRPREIEEILGENQFETERRMLEAQAAAEAQRRESEEFESRLPHIPKRKPEIPDEVEIVPKKRVRQIRVRPQAEDGSSELPFAGPPTETPEGREDMPAVVRMELPEVPAAAETAQNPEEPASPNEGEPVEMLSALAPLGLREDADAAAVAPAPPEPAPAEPAERVEAAPVQAAAEPEPEPVWVGPAPGEPVASAPTAEPSEPEHAAADRTVKPPLAATPTGRTGPVDAPPTRWKSWKEKIQTFIRKLFG